MAWVWQANHCFDISIHSDGSHIGYGIGFITLSLCSDTGLPFAWYPFSRGLTERMSASPLAISQKYGHVIMPLDQNKRILRQPRAIVFTTHLHYAPALMRLITSPKSSMRYPRVFSLIKGDTISVGNASQCYAVTLAGCDYGRPRAKGISFFCEGWPPPPPPLYTHARQLPMRKPLPP